MISNKTYYFNMFGVMQTGLQTVEGKLKAFDGSGSMITGFWTENQSTYFFDETSGEAVTGFIKEMEIPIILTRIIKW